MDVSTTPSTANTCFSTIRRDGSSAWRKEQPLGTFPSASLAWRMSEEKFIKDLNVFDDLKFVLVMVLVVTHSDSELIRLSDLQYFCGWFNYTNANGTQNSYHTIPAAASKCQSRPKMGTYSHVMNIGLDFNSLE